MANTLELADSALEEENTSESVLLDVFDRAIERFDLAVLPQLPGRALSLAARRFTSIPGAMWEGEFGEMFENTVKVESDKIFQGLDKIDRDYRDNRVVPDFRPAGSESDHETADTLDGMHRADAYHFKSSQAWDNAFQEGSSGGMGAYRLTTEWDDPYDKDNDQQRINPGLIITDADQRVFFDPDSRLYDKSDARYGFVLTGMSPQRCKDDYGDDAATSWPDMALRPSQYDWFRPEVIIIAEYYEVEDVDENLLIFMHTLTREEQRIWSSDITPQERADLVALGFQVRQRRQKRCRVHKYVMNGAQVLKDQGFVSGAHIPVVPYYGKRWFVDGVERFEGYTQRKMDMQRVYNSMLSKNVESDALAPREIPIFLSEQMPPHLAELWARQNVDRHAYALVEPVRGADGTPIAMGPIGKIEPPQLSPVRALLLQAAMADLSQDMAEADEVKSNTSAEAMDIAATRIDAKSGIYLDNWRQTTQRGGEIYLSMAADVYWEPGRKVETMTEDGDDGEAELQEPTYGDDGKFRIKNDFTKGRYKVIADVTEATSTRRDKTVRAALGTAEVAQKIGDTATAKAAMLTAIMNQDGEGMTDLQAFARKQAIEIGLVEPNEEEQQKLAEAAQNQQPDPTALALQAQAKDLEASAALKTKQAEKAEADIGLSEAKIIETLASAEQKKAQTGVAQQDARTRMFSAQSGARKADNDVALGRMKISMGRDLPKRTA